LEKLHPPGYSMGTRPHHAQLVTAVLFVFETGSYCVDPELIILLLASEWSARIIGICCHNSGYNS
jgi:hypothetical protein